MAIVTQYPYVDENGNENETLIKTYSDSGKYIVQNETGIEYVEAIDVLHLHTYTETEKDIEQVAIEEEISNEDI